MSYNLNSENNEETAVYTYGRHNPPTVGHEKLFDKTVEVAKQHNAIPHIYTSHTQDNKKNPLTVDHKVSLIQSAYPNAHVASSSKEMPSLLHIAKHLHSQGYKHLVMVAGDDRVEEFKDKLKQYNGTDEKSLYNFKTISVVSSGHRDPDAEGVEGMSGTKLRSHAISGNREGFKSGLLSKLSDSRKEEIYKHTVKALSNTEGYNESDRLRSLYIAGMLYKVNQIVETTGGVRGRIDVRGSNYVIVEHEDGTKRSYWLNEINETTLGQLEFDGVITKYFEHCPQALTLFSQLIKKAQAGEDICSYAASTIDNSAYVRHMQIHHYTNP